MVPLKSMLQLKKVKLMRKLTMLRVGTKYKFATGIYVIASISHNNVG